MHLPRPLTSGRIPHASPTSLRVAQVHPEPLRRSMSPLVVKPRPRTGCLPLSACAHTYARTYAHTHAYTARALIHMSPRPCSSPVPSSMTVHVLPVSAPRRHPVQIVTPAPMSPCAEQQNRASHYKGGDLVSFLPLHSGSTRTLFPQKGLAPHTFTERLLPNCCYFHDPFHDLRSALDQPAPRFVSPRVSMPVPVPTRTPTHAIDKPLPINAPPPGLVKQSALKHLLNSLPEPPSGPPPAFTDRETWIKSLPPSRRYKRKDATLVSRALPTSIAGCPSPISLVIAPNLSLIKTESGSAPVLKVAHAPLSNAKPWPPSPPKAIKQAIEADERRKSMLGDTIVACDSSRDADDELSEEWTEDEAVFAGPTVDRQTSVKRVTSLEEK